MEKMLESKVTLKDYFSVRENYYQSTVDHSHNFFELMYVADGFLLHSVNSLEETKMEKGDFMIMDIGVIHKYTGENLKLINFSFLPEILDKEYKDAKTVLELLTHPVFNLKNAVSDFPSNTVLKDDDGRILSVIEAIKIQLANKKALSENILKHLLVSLILQIISSNDLGQNSQGEITKEVLAEINQNYAEDDILKNISKRLNYSLSYVSSVFKKDMGITFKEYLQKHRMEKASKLLESTDKLVSEISLMVGYSDLKSFNMLFRRYMKMTPSEYRRLKKLSNQLKTDLMY